MMTEISLIQASGAAARGGRAANARGGGKSPFNLMTWSIFEESPDAARVRAIRDPFILARLTNWETICRRNGFLVAARVLLAAQIGFWSSLVLT
jgi:hypothetical protein